MDADLARQIWRYDPETGKFFWLVSSRYKVLIGDEAGYFDGKYNRLAYAGKQYKSARVAWLMMTGKWPVDQIDHINQVKTDDRFCNLREATNAQNVCNAKVRGRSSVRGIFKRAYGYQVYLHKGFKHFYIGSFKNLEDAVKARNFASQKLHGEFATQERLL